VPIFIALPERGVTVHSGDMGYTMGPFGEGARAFRTACAASKKSGRSMGALSYSTFSYSRAAKIFDRDSQL
jgi:hypothetical protein